MNEKREEARPSQFPVIEDRRSRELRIEVRSLITRLGSHSFLLGFQLFHGTRCPDEILCLLLHRGESRARVEGFLVLPLVGVEGMRRDLRMEARRGLSRGHFLIPGGCQCKLSQQIHLHSGRWVRLVVLVILDVSSQERISMQSLRGDVLRVSC